MPIDYRDAADRHWDDAEHLFSASRFANADHLYGLSAECTLKAVMLGLGMRLRPDGRPEDPYAVHIDKLWDEFLFFVERKGGDRYAERLRLGANPFSDWNVAQRYHHRSEFTKEKVSVHRDATGVARQALADAQLDGILS